MTKIAFVSPGKLPQPAVKGGAVEGLIDLLVESLGKQKDKYEVHVYSVGEKDENKTIDEVKYHYIKNDGFSNQLARKARGIINVLSSNIYVGNNYVNKVANRISKENGLFDVIVVQNVPEYGLVLKKCNAKKYILHMHNNGFNKNSKCAREIFDLYDEIYTISGTVRKYVCSICESQKVKVLYNGVDYSIFGKRITQAERQAQKEKMNFNDADLVYVFAGRLTKEKGVRELILAFKQLVEKKPTAKLMIIGSSFFDGAKDTEYVSELKKLAEPIKDKIVFTGFINHEELYKWYQLGDVGIIPSQWDEPFALTVIEEMMSGLPVIASKCGGIVEITNKECAILIEQNDKYVENLEKAMGFISENTAMRKDMASKAVEQAKKFDSEKYCETFEKYVNDIMDMD